MNFPVNLKKLRENAGITQKQLAEKAGIAVTQISNFECGPRLPNIANLVKIKRALKCSFDDLLK